MAEKSASDSVAPMDSLMDQVDKAVDDLQTMESWDGPRPRWGNHGLTWYNGVQYYTIEWSNGWLQWCLAHVVPTTP